MYEGIICGIEKSIIPISIGIWREAQKEGGIRRGGIGWYWGRGGGAEPAQTVPAG